MRGKNIGSGVLEFIEAIQLYYQSEEMESVLAKLTKVLQEDFNNCIAKELMACIYYDNKMWGNALAYFEQVEESDQLGVYFNDSLDFYMAWSYGKIKDTENEIKYYLKCLQINPNYQFARNNLGYAYLKTKQYGKALDTFQQCIENNLDLKYSYNNLARTLIAMGKINEAEKCISNSPTKIYKDVLERLNKAKEKQLVVPVDIISEDKESAIEASPVTIGIKKQQFSSEKILEDELTLRIESGIPVFGKKLKIYRRKGEYGRQYIIPIGRLDILAEDEEGNLYVIELKKDSGYDDVYKQTVNYLEWFEKNKDLNGKRVYGIICLNNPTKKTINAVRRDTRIKLYEYQISYCEVN